MSSITIIGTGNMARTIGALAVAGGNVVEVIGRDQSKAADLEGMGLVAVGLAQHGLGNLDFALGVTVPGPQVSR